MASSSAETDVAAVDSSGNLDITKCAERLYHLAVRADRSDVDDDDLQAAIDDCQHALDHSA